MDLFESGEKMTECFPEPYDLFGCTRRRIEGKELAQIIRPIFKQKIILLPFGTSFGPLQPHHPASKASNDSVFLSEVLISLFFIFVRSSLVENFQGELSNLCSDRESGKRVTA